MEYVTGKREFQIEEPTVVTLGKFDGRHRGHQKLKAAMKRAGAGNGYKTAVCPFGTSRGCKVKQPT